MCEARVILIDLVEQVGNGYAKLAIGLTYRMIDRVLYLQQYSEYRCAYTYVRRIYEMDPSDNSWLTSTR